MKTSWLILLIVIVIILIYNLRYYNQFKQVGVAGDTRKWNVVGAYGNSADVAAAMSRMHKRVLILCAFLKKKYQLNQTDDVIAKNGGSPVDKNVSHSDGRQLAFYLLRDYNPDVIYETDPKYTSDTSYNINKGSEIYMCMRQKNNPDILEDDNILTFVILHELSHTIEKYNWGHENIFWTTFKWLLQQAVEAGIYVPEDYSVNNKVFCGLKITYNPLYDATLSNIAN